MMKLFVYGVVAMSMASMFGCTTLVTSKYLRKNEDKTGQGDGWVYSLPKGQVLLQASRRPITAQDLTAATKAVDTANQTLKADILTLNSACETQGDRKKPTKEQIKADAEVVARLQKVVDTDNEILANAKKYLITLQTNGKGRGIETFSLAPQQVAPDPAGRYITNLNHSALRDDSFKVSLKDGLLATANTTSTDRSVDAIVSAASTAVSVVTFLAGGIPIIPPAVPKGLPGPAVELEEIVPTPPEQFPLVCTYEIAVVFDPLNPDEVNAVNKKLCDAKATIRVEVPGVTSALVLPCPASQGDTSQGGSETAKCASCSAPAASGNSGNVITGTLDGLAYRVPTSVVVTVKPVEGENNIVDWQTGLIFSSQPFDKACMLQSKPAAQSLLLIVPDSQTSYAISAKAGAFTTTAQSYTFTSGMLTDHSLTRPSEVMAPLEGIGKLAQGVMAIPGAIFKLRLDFTENQDKLVKAQADLINTRATVTTNALAAQKSIEDAKASLIKAQFAGQQAQYDAQASLVKAQFADQQAWYDAQASLVKAQQELQKLLTLQLQTVQHRLSSSLV